MSLEDETQSELEEKLVQIIKDRFMPKLYPLLSEITRITCEKDDLEARLKQAQQLLDEDIPVFTMPFLNGKLEAVSDYVQKMDGWLNKLRGVIKQ